MKKLVTLFLAGSVIAAGCVGNPDGEKAETSDAATPAATQGAASLKVDTTSSIAWLGKKVSGSHNGTIKLQDGELFFTDGKLSGGSFSIDMNTLTNEDLTDPEYRGKLEAHLKADDFFAVEKFPVSKFEITGVEDKGNNELSISGNLTIRDSTKNITFPAIVTESAADKFAATADFNINRLDWGVQYTGMKDDLISKEINFKVALSASKQ